MRKIAALLTALLLLTGCAAAGTGTPTPTPAAPTPEASLAPVEPAPAGAKPVPVMLDGTLTAKGWEKNGCVYVPVRALCAAFGQEMSWSGDERSFSLHIDRLTVRGTRGQEYYTAAGRYVWAPEDWLIRGGELYLPARALEKLFSLETERDKDGKLAISSEGMALLTGGDDYYELNYPTEELYWLSHIIAAEARFEPLDGQIGVGNVVMNRVRSERFPGTVFEVIYDTANAIQFMPIALGGIREDPSEQAMIAACLVLEGAETVGDSLYFVNPDYADTWWFDSALEQTARIGNHNFYSERSE